MLILLNIFKQTLAETMANIFRGTRAKLETHFHKHTELEGERAREREEKW